MKMKIRLTPHHQTLLDIAFRRYRPEEVHPDEHLPLEQVFNGTLFFMRRLMEIEFYASLQKEIDNVEENTTVRSKPNPYDVFLVEPSFRNQNIDIAVAVPIKGMQDVLCWYDENGECWDLDELVPRRKVSSLSGVVRVTENLGTSPIPRLMQQAMARTNIFDASTLELAPDDVECVDALNASQNKAVSVIKSQDFDSGFFVVQGPPGTGKSTTLVQMICAKHQRVIASAPSNAATANIALKLFKTSKFDHRNLCVYGQNCDETVRFLNPTLRRDRYFALLAEIRNEADEKNVERVFREFCTWLHISPESSRDYVESLCTLYEDEIFLEVADVICCSLNSSGSAYLRKHVGKRETFFLDEAGQCNEAEFYLATTFPTVRRIVLVGDPKQLPPTTIDPGCKRAGHGTSWMERVYSLDLNNIHLLDTQYRMDPLILRFPNKEFYGNRIKSGAHLSSRSPLISRPVAFVDTSNRSREERDSNFSTKNAGEAIIIRALIRQDEDIQAILQEPKAKVVVITPYAAQALLLRSELKKIKGFHCWSVSTVDSYQGQEADVVIISTVRTEKIGFVDDPQRLNVALTRAKRVMRIVGYKTLFDRLGKDSPLRKLAKGLSNQKYTIEAKVKNIVYSLPDWRKKSLWKPAMTQRFHHHLRQLAPQDRAVALNTLQAVVSPNLRQLQQRPSNNYWQISSFRGQPCCIVWVAKNDLTIEAHLAGTRATCLSFVQRYISNLPMGSCKVRQDMTGVCDEVVNTSRAEPSWDLSNFLQLAIENNSMSDLPEGSFHLDIEQQLIASSPPPLLLESRSGTGKTNVLFQHAISLAQDLADRDSMPLAFITVSKRLQSHLEQIYGEVKDINNAALQSCVFLSLSDLLDGLAKRMKLEMPVSEITCFEEYACAKKSHSTITIDATLVENEIGGVIAGSLKSAELRRPLTWEEYQDDRRSNITNKNQDSSTIRSAIFEQYQLYNKWKREFNRYDIHDIVLEIIKRLIAIGSREKCQIFSAIYLDEIQDFSYAMIYLICSIGGANGNSPNWIFAGDTAQMISPGSSFKFAGLKETLLSIHPGIENRLKNVSQLLVNYRTTKDVLQLGNAILAKAKTHYPGAIEFAKPERAINDFGLKVVLNYWDSALKTKPLFGKDQALIYCLSKEHQQNSYEGLKGWLGNHPFILSVLESKGLEFDDVVVAFDLERSSWKAESREVAALNMLRHLYVAVTRAKRRVIILVKRRSDSMLKFFSSLDYDLNFHEDTEKLFSEFNTFTSNKQWFERAEELFKNERYELASRCYEKSESPGMAAFARGKHFAVDRKKEEARREFLVACELFEKQCEYEMVLKIAVEMLDVVSWDDRAPEFLSYEVLNAAKTKFPDYLSRSARVKLDIFQDKWENISLDDIENENVVVNKRRGFPGLESFVQQLSDTQVQRLTKALPCIVGDMRYGREEFFVATDLYLRGKDYVKAEKSSLKIIHVAKKSNTVMNDLLKVIELWQPFKSQLSNQRTNRTLSILFQLQNDPENLAKTHSDQCLDLLGKNVIKFIVDQKGFDRTLLHSFCPNTFHSDVLKELQRKYDDQAKVVRWFLDRDDLQHATQLILGRLSQWDPTDLKTFFAKKLASEEIAKEFFKRGLYLDATDLFIQCEKMDIKINSEMIFNSADKAVSNTNIAESNSLKIMRLLQGVKKPKSNLIPHRIELLTELFKAPEKVEKETRQKIMKTFGPAVVQKFVLRTSSYTVNGEYRDVLDVLDVFGSKAKLNRRAVLDHFHMNKMIPRAKDFIENHRTEWTKKDLIDIVDKFEYHSESLGKEFQTRGMHLKAAEVYLKQKCIQDAIRESEKFLSNKVYASKYAFGLKILWLDDQNKSRYPKVQKKLQKNSYLSLFLRLYQEPEYVAKSGNCFHYFDPHLVKSAILHSYLTKPDKFEPDPVTILKGQNSFGDFFNVSRLSVLRDLKQMSQGKSCDPVKKYIERNRDNWTWEKVAMTRDDLLIFLDLDAPFKYIEDSLMKLRCFPEVVELVKLHLRKGSLQDAMICSNLAFDDENFQDYMQSLDDVWSDYVNSAKEIDTGAILKLRKRPLRLGSVLLERKLFEAMLDLVKLDLEGLDIQDGSFADAISCSEKALIEDVSQNHGESLLLKWSNLLSTTEIDDISLVNEVVELVKLHLRIGSLEGAVTCSNLAFDHENFQDHAQSLDDAWSDYIDNAKEIDTDALFKLRKRPSHLRSVLLKRELFENMLDLVELDLQDGSLPDSISCSERDLINDAFQNREDSLFLKWSNLLKTMKNKHIRTLFDLNHIPFGFESILAERRMFPELVKLYLGEGSTADAISCSINALEDSNLKTHAEPLFEVLHAADGEIVDALSKNAKLWMFLQLFRDPFSASTSEYSSDCISIFGPTVVECAVRRSVETDKVRETLDNFDPELFKQQHRTKKQKQRKKKKKPKKKK